MTHTGYIAKLREALRQCDEAMAYMSEYDIPICLPDRVKEALALPVPSEWNKLSDGHKITMYEPFLAIIDNFQNDVRVLQYVFDGNNVVLAEGFGEHPDIPDSPITYIYYMPIPEQPQGLNGKQEATPVPEVGKDKSPPLFIQWKGTNVCIDLDCNCGWVGCHYDGDFLYHYKCPKCGTIWKMPTELHATRMSKEDVEESAGGCLVTFRQGIDNNEFYEDEWVYSNGTGKEAWGLKGK